MFVFARSEFGISELFILFGALAEIKSETISSYKQPHNYNYHSSRVGARAFGYAWMGKSLQCCEGRRQRRKRLTARRLRHTTAPAMAIRVKVRASLPAPTPHKGTRRATCPPGRERTGKTALTVGAADCPSPAKALRERVALKLDDHKHDSCAVSACQHPEKPPFALLRTCSERLLENS